MKFLNSLVIGTVFTAFLAFPSGASAQSAHDQQYPATYAPAVSGSAVKNAPINGTVSAHEEQYPTAEGPSTSEIAAEHPVSKDEQSVVTAHDEQYPETYEPSTSQMAQRATPSNAENTRQLSREPVHRIQNGSNTDQRNM